ncbi:MAG: hypothetical protein LBF43_00725 [Puniceicoccales bacterium]|nr:hypothetical protein [Puniceicoccales bacterium]
MLVFLVPICGLGTNVWELFDSPEDVSFFLSELPLSNNAKKVLEKWYCNDDLLKDIRAFLEAQAGRPIHGTFEEILEAWLSYPKLSFQVRVDLHTCFPGDYPGIRKQILAVRFSPDVDTKKVFENALAAWRYFQKTLDDLEKLPSGKKIIDVLKNLLNKDRRIKTVYNVSDAKGMVADLVFENGVYQPILKGIGNLQEEKTCYLLGLWDKEEDIGVVLEKHLHILL